MTKLEKSIMKTIAYFDMLGYPLTVTETWKWLYKPDVPASERTYDAVEKALESKTLSAILARVEAFYCFIGREQAVFERKVRNVRVDRQMRKAVLLAKILRFIPYVRMLALVSSISTGNVKEDSDIDLFIVTQKNRIWLTRLLVVGVLKILRKRPTAQRKKDMFCASFFVSEDALNIESGSFGHDDISYQYYVASIVPLYETHKTYEKFLEANRWLSAYLPNAYHEERLTWEVACPAWLSVLHGVIAIILWPLFNGPLSDWYPNMQLKIMPVQLKELANIDSRVIITDWMLKFHDKDNRQELKHRWSERVQLYERHGAR